MYDHACCSLTFSNLVAPKGTVGLCSVKTFLVPGGLQEEVSRSPLAATAGESGLLSSPDIQAVVDWGRVHLSFPLITLP